MKEICLSTVLQSNNLLISRCPRNTISGKNIGIRGHWLYCRRQFTQKIGLILHTPGPEIHDLACHIHSLLTLLTQLLTLLRHMILQWFQPKWLSMDLCIHGKTILLVLLRLLTCHHIKLSKMSNLSRGQNSCMNMPTHKHTSNIDIIWVYT